MRTPIHDQTTFWTQLLQASVCDTMDDIEEEATAHNIKEQLFHTTVREQTVGANRKLFCHFDPD